MKIDDTDRRIINELIVNGRATNRQIASNTGLSQPTVALRLANLLDNLVVRILAQRDLQSMGYPLAAIVEVRVDGRSVKDVFNDLIQLQSVVGVVESMDYFQLMTTVKGRDLEHIHDVMQNEIMATAGVREIVSHVSLKTIKHRTTSAAIERAVAPPQISTDLPFDEKIIRLLQINGRLTNSEIARQLGTSEGSVRSQIHRMIDDKRIVIRGIVNSRYAGRGVAALVRLRVRGREDELCAALAALDEVSYLSLVCGQYTMLAVVGAESADLLHDTLRDQIETRTDVADLSVSMLGGTKYQRYDLTVID